MINEEQLERLMYLIELPGMMDDESVGDRFDFEYQDGKSFIPDFLKWLGKENPELRGRINRESSPSGIEYEFWFDNLSRPEEDLEYESFKECARFILSHKEAFEGVINYIEKFFEDEEWFNEFEWWDDIKEYTSDNIGSLDDAKKMFEDLKKDYETLYPIP